MTTLHITSGDFAGNLIKTAGFDGEVLVWRDVLYEGRRKSGWPDAATIDSRAEMLSASTGGGLTAATIRQGLLEQYEKISRASDYEAVLLWFDACLYDQAMLAHILSCLADINTDNAELICIDSYPGIVPFNGLGQLGIEGIQAIYPQRRKVSKAQFELAVKIDEAFSSQDTEQLRNLSSVQHPEYPWISAAITRLLQETPDTVTGLGKLETLALDAVKTGLSSPIEIFRYAAAHDTSPQYWGDTTLWAKLNSLADRKLIKIDGPKSRLPQWISEHPIESFKVTPY